jgi:sterol desaturase/sphingolipid hydroxylase (fatty acid hydroxylase superfamily)
MAPLEKLRIALAAIPGIALNHGFWYLLLAGMAWLGLHWLLARRLARRRINPQVLTRQQLRREFFCSLRSVFIFGLMGGFVVFAVVSGWTWMYFRVERYGWPWLIGSIGVMILIHDTYFYWTHRLMHHPRLYRLFHRTHHLSTSPSPWAAYAFSPLEAAVQAGIAPLIVFTVPVHPLCFSIFMIWQISFNVLGHCGYEMFPRWFLRSWLGRVVNTSTHHAQHHEAFRANFSLYFNVWDRLMGTNHARYAQRFAQAVGDASIPVAVAEAADAAARSTPGGPGLRGLSPSQHAKV